VQQNLERLLKGGHSELHHLHESISKAVALKYKDLIRETVNEQARVNNFLRIYPAKGSCQYDQFFSGHRPYNKLMYKVFYTDEILKQERVVSPQLVSIQIPERQMPERKPVYSRYQQDESSASTTARDQHKEEVKEAVRRQEKP